MSNAQLTSLYELTGHIAMRVSASRVKRRRQQHVPSNKIRTCADYTWDRSTVIEFAGKGYIGTNS